MSKCQPPWVAPLFNLDRDMSTRVLTNPSNNMVSSCWNAASSNRLWHKKLVSTSYYFPCHPWTQPQPIICCCQPANHIMSIHIPRFIPKKLVSTSYYFPCHPWTQPQHIICCCSLLMALWVYIFLGSACHTNYRAFGPGASFWLAIRQVRRVIKASVMKYTMKYVTYSVAQARQ